MPPSEPCRRTFTESTLSILQRAGYRGGKFGPWSPVRDARTLYYDANQLSPTTAAAPLNRVFQAQRRDVECQYPN